MEANDQTRVVEVSTRKPTQAPILSLVNPEYLKSTANTSRAMWEPMSYLFSETEKSLQRVDAMDLPGCTGPDSCKGTDDRRLHNTDCVEWARKATISRRHQILAWLQDLLVQSGSVDALRSNQLMTGLQPAQNNQARPSGAIMPDYPQPQPAGQEKPRRRMMGG